METYRHSNRYQFTVKNVARDESCQFRSFALLLEDDETEHTH
jgi:hypothetical protein